jgi:hypothetical protein
MSFSKKIEKRHLILALALILVLSIVTVPHQLAAEASVGSEKPLVNTLQAASGGGGKIILAIMRGQFHDQSGLVNMFRPYLDTNEMVMTHPNASNLDFALELPGIKGVEYFSLAEIMANAAILKAKGISFISYDIENKLSPASEMADPVASVRTAAQIIHKAGMLFMVAPSRNTNLRYASQFAAFADIYNPQGQALQPNPAQYAAYYDNISSQIRAANPRIKIIAEVSTARGDLQNMEKCFSLVSNVVDGVTVWYQFKDLAQVNEFLSWHRSNY